MTLNFVGMIILARLVSPGEFGVFAVAAGVVLLASYLSEIGGSWALIQRPEISPRHVGSALAFSLTCAALLMALIYFSAGGFADLMRMDSVEPVLRAMCLVIPVQAATGVPRALMRRGLAYGSMVRAELLAAVVAMVSGISYALVSPTVYALVLQAVSYQVLTFGMLWWLTDTTKVGFPSVRASKELMGFAGGQTLYEAIVMFSKNLDTFLIGRVLGATQLGFYSRAFTLVFTPLGQVYSAIGSVAFSAMSREQGNPSRLAHMSSQFLLGVGIFISMPLMIFAPFTREFVAVVLGNAWLESAPVFHVLVLSASVQALYANMLWVVQAFGMMRVQLRVGILMILINLTGFGAGAVSGQLVWFGAAYLVSSVAGFMYLSRQVSRSLGRPVPYFRAIVSLVVVAIAAGEMLHFAARELSSVDILRLLLLVVTLVLVMAVCAWRIRHLLPLPRFRISVD